MNCKEDISLKPFNTFGIDVNAKFFIELESVEDVVNFCRSEWKDENRLVLGGGSNLLFTGDFDGVVLKNSMLGIELVEDRASEVLISASAGENWHEFVLYCIDKGWGGIENLSLIPGQVGAAPIQNIGAYGVEIKDVFEYLDAVSLETGEIKRFYHSDCEFGYRDSIFKRGLKGKFVICRVVLRLKKDPELNLTYGAIKSTLEAHGVSEPGISDVSKAVISIRQSKLPDPSLLGNSGSFFKNPVIKPSQFKELLLKYPSIPHYHQENGDIKVPAGWLIEQCGWKGKKVGNTGSHKDQALVLVNYGGASG